MTSTARPENEGATKEVIEEFFVLFYQWDDLLRVGHK